MMDSQTAPLIEKDRNHVWHHLSQHSSLKQQDPIIMVKGGAREFGMLKEIVI